MSEGKVYKDGKFVSQKINPSFIERFITCFSVQDTLTMLTTRRSKDKEDAALEGINAIRVICMAHIICGVVFFRTLTGPIQNMEVLDTWV
jgi:hypothetical protein